MRKFIFLFIASLIGLPMTLWAQDYERVPYGPDERQFMDIYTAPSQCPTPVYFDAHGNGGTTDMPSSIVEELMAEGVSIVAWESLTSVGTPAEVDTGWNDAELMFAWVKENADTYNFDTTKFIIGGSSRGSILSWKYSHRGDPNIKGLYMYNALPDGTWADSTWWYPPNEIKATSPPIFFVYRFEPGVAFDSHDPNNGFIIMDKYDELGIGDRDTLIHSIQYSGNNDKYQFLIEFIRSVISPCQPVNTSEVEDASPKYKLYPNPFRDRLQLSGLKGDEYFVLRSSQGRIIQESKNPDVINQSMRSGVYFLTIQFDGLQHTYKLVKI
ncbi:MAG: T9SS type A sorting domain-containing protein [Bacteroidota bacterium]